MSESIFEALDAWKAERIGKITSSEISNLLAKSKPVGEAFTKGAITYINETIAEVITGEAAEINGKALEWGAANEFEAIMEYERRTGFKVDYYGVGNPKFFPYESFAGGSPDGIVTSLNRLLEVKCPYNSGNHVAFLRMTSQGDLKKRSFEYYSQAQMNLLCTGSSDADFISYDPRVVAKKHRLKIIHVERDEILIEEIKWRITAAAKIISETINSFAI